MVLADKQILSIISASLSHFVIISLSFGTLTLHKNHMLPADIHILSIISAYLSQLFYDFPFIRYANNTEKSRICLEKIVARKSTHY